MVQRDASVVSTSSRFAAGQGARHRATLRWPGRGGRHAASWAVRVIPRCEASQLALTDPGAAEEDAVYAVAAVEPSETSAGRRKASRTRWQPAAMQGHEISRQDNRPD